jgi:hypothetical protein
MGIRRRFGLPLLVLATPLLVAACGGGGGDDVIVAQSGVQPSGLFVVPDNGATTPALLAAFAADNLYYNAHTTANPAGEIRGQLDGAGTIKFATLSGTQETPSVSTSAFGGGVLAVDTATGRVSGFFVASGLVNATAAHVHNAARGTPGGVVITLLGGPEIWVVPDSTIRPDLVPGFLADNLYFNAHTTANPTGEIRGQIDKPGAVKLATLTGAQETPAVTTPALGGGALSFDAATGRVGGFFVASGLVNATAAHVHNAARGTPGGVVITLLGGPGIWVVPDNTIRPDLAAAFAADNLYYNAHTTANPAGEIRGQIDKPEPANFATLTGAQETPSVATAAFGAGILSVDGATGRVGGFFRASGLVDQTAAHVHNAARGTPGGVVVPLLAAP